MGLRVLETILCSIQSYSLKGGESILSSLESWSWMSDWVLVSVLGVGVFRAEEVFSPTGRQQKDNRNIVLVIFYSLSLIWSVLEYVDSWGNMTDTYSSLVQLTH